jgi:hypothetical protein
LAGSLNSYTDAWQGSTHSDVFNIDYIPFTESSYTFDQTRDGHHILTGANTIYFRTVDKAGNFSEDGTIRTGTIYYAGQAPTFGALSKVTISPETSTTNSFALSWPAATPGSGRSISGYYYMVNQSPPTTYSTLSTNSSTYINNGTLRTVSARTLPNINRGTNTVYIVAVDDASTPNYSPSNYISGTFTLNSSEPDNVANFTVSDSSIKSQSKWNVALTWTAPTYQGAGNLTYRIYRSADNLTFSEVGSTSGLSYVDSTPLSALYYYKVYTKDGANALSSGTNAVSILPTGKWTSAPTIESAPKVSGITTKKAIITWSTNRTADSKVQYGLSSGSYLTEEPSNSNQVASHTITLSNLTPGKTYHYKVKWTDEDGNTGISSEYTFVTQAAPSVSSVKTTNISISSALVTFTVTNASKVTVEYGKTTSYGGAQTLSTSISSSTYTVSLTDLSEGTIYHLRITAKDEEGNSFAGDDYQFETLPTPKILNLRVQQVMGMPAATIRLIWESNSPTSSIITYYPSDNVSKALDQISLALTKKHEMIIKNLIDDRDYIFIVKGKDSASNEAKPETKNVKTATDIRPPEIQNMNVESTIVGVGEDAKAQIIISWDTDEPATTQIEYAQGTGNNYGQTTQEDTSLTTNHLVTIPGLSPSRIYHLRAISKDKVDNAGMSFDTVVVTPKSTVDALNLVIDNLSNTFGFLKGKTIK